MIKFQDINSVISIIYFGFLNQTYKQNSQRNALQILNNQWLSIKKDIIQYLCVVKLLLKGKIERLLKNLWIFFNFRYINIWFHLEDLERRMKFVAHISINDAFGQLLNELSTMEERFYDDFDGQKLKRLPTKDYMKDFAINGMKIVPNKDIIH